MNKLTLAVAASLFAIAGASAHAADLAAGQEAFQKYTCATCHGADGKTSTLPTYPILAGQHADYLVHALKTYKRGQAGAPATANVRKNAVMGAMVQQLSNADIENIAAWLASLPSPLSISK
ncbi:c-type cytochrome [Pusillimonas noertemannii]|uniref:Cytochrome c553 n=1 Tax=Pusillimonas noertemannii TaxID=305977 RepID=A0A2U1CRM1_9BURK|nr:cytochrome c [Pusillimonas noertemannii]NYT67877.1 cytochrome c [Pusillimonas noertemannii]PVY68547.1 cytochrome c553 [Pusillimonas noertemannii]TFL11979.1 cytochrome c [Pusillimonas noertemannii]